MQKLSEKDENDVKATIESTVTKLIESSLIPSFESISKEMLSELSKTLISGTQECMYPLNTLNYYFQILFFKTTKTPKIKT